MKTPTRPFFSVLVATHNRREMLKRALRSVLGQSERDYEIVLVDDGSTDGAADAARELFYATGTSAQIIHLPENRGIPAARNAGLAAATGEIAAFLDSDDVWHPTYLALLKSAFQASPRPAFAFTDYLSHGPRVTGPVHQYGRAVSDPVAEMVTRPFIHTMSCFAAPLKAVRAVGGFTESLSRFSDLDIYVRLLAQAKGGKRAKAPGFAYLPQAAVLKTIHLDDRNLEGYERDWAKCRDLFLDTVFKYPCLRRRRRLRPTAEAALLEGQRRFFANFHREGASGTA